MRIGNTLRWVELPNSGDTLKLIIPSCIRKIISGWSNDSCKVISYEISEKIMGNRGSKSNFLLKFVKEQRVDGNWWNKPFHLRYTLMGSEKNYLIKIPSKLLNKKNFSTFKLQSKMTPWFCSGLIDSEGSFITTIYKNKEIKIGWRVQSIFQIELHIQDLSLLLQLQQFFGGCGSIIKSKNRNTVRFSVSDIKDLTTIIIPHFYKYPLLTQKSADFILFQQVVELMSKKGHLSMDGLHQIINIKASMNWGISEIVKTEFLSITPVDRPLIEIRNIHNPNWVAGFVSGDGNFDVRVLNSNKNKIGYQVYLRFRISQHEKDLKLMELLKKYLGSGTIEKNSKDQVVSLTISKFSDITNKITPFFELNPLLGVKQLDYLDWCKIANLMKEGSHFTIEGLELIRSIKSGMNTGRKFPKI
uniref:LAGLIDADG endonuclease n=1 Tax=Clavaria fumosa TaxID=264083 RepID=A0A7T3PCV4_9AGAR|nr:LAGLIDADG endonuclease [Clavaria fumosa]QPZ51109.1 LAGLIDADG endonuclease [Clavaria fumosa]